MHLTGNHVASCAAGEEYFVRSFQDVYVDDFLQGAQAPVSQSTSETADLQLWGFMPVSSAGHPRSLHEKCSGLVAHCLGTTAGVDHVFWNLQTSGMQALPKNI